MQLTKHHGLGNDFLVAFVPDVPDGVAAMARRWCHRRHGIGADGLILATPPAADGTDLGFRLWNADGSPAGMSGNGLRCLGHAEARRRGVARAALVIGTPGGSHRVLVAPAEEPHTATVTVQMGPVRPGPALAGAPAVPTVVPRRAGTADLGNPHVVILVDDPGAVDLHTAGPRVEALFPGGINVHFVAPDGAGGLSMRTFERGAGVTEACGSGAVAAAVLAHRWGLTGDRVAVRMPGGVAEVAVDDEATLTGPATYVGDIEVPDG